ncbi:class I SAM-dependent methyltransferase [Acinetobacter sp. V91_7]|uniref:SAM-dependent methyltransferase n=1 Tax=unclassified Acinetobacter TaxID=196816 RepID=UPI00287E2FCB|nr:MULTISPECIES: class I SAM-dependent methyltransferase [unclassified Acinetobacter]MDS7934054.1 class I SAM-dependent methyltransferase [Acinetobacter sp. V91_4B]MDS7962610.1 class I SAM-dependent methyltransferase [Acinetobacter sp. V91_7]MDS8029487.1 class I SAM-dependent methyltransferase [Acinetobacter sp. V91_13]
MAKDFNSPKVVDGYDEHIRKLIPGYEVIHQQVDAILQSVLKPNSHILIVGCGTGYELEYLLKRHPNWKFTAVDPSLTMLQKAQEQVELLGKSSQVTFIHGETSALPLENCFDAALSILVAHFIADDIKPAFFKDIYDRLNENAVLLTYDLMTCINPQQLQALRYLCLAQGLTEEQCQKMLERMAQDFFSLTTEGYIKLLQKTGFESVQSYAQVLIYQGFIAKK